MMNNRRTDGQQNGVTEKNATSAGVVSSDKFEAFFSIRKKSKSHSFTTKYFLRQNDWEVLKQKRCECSINYYV